MNEQTLKITRIFQAYDISNKKISFEAYKNSPQLLIESPCIPYIPQLGEKVGIYPAVFLQQVHYWALKGFGEKKLGKIWVNNTYEAWADQLRCSVSCIRKTVNKLIQEGLIEMKAFRSKYGDTSKWYAINYEALTKLGFKLHSEEAAPNQKALTADCQGLPLTLNENQPPTNDNESPLSPPNQENGRNTRVNQKNGANERVSHCDTPLSKTTKVIYNLSPACAESVFENMISIWNETIHQGQHPIKFTESRLKRLKRRFLIEFQGCIEKWKAFCELISKNDFLMGMGKKGWKATLDWALESENIKKVLTNHYQHWVRKKEKVPLSLSRDPCKPQAQIEAETQEILAKIEASPHPVFWKETSKKLVTALGAAKFESWIYELVPQRLQENELILKAPTRFIRDSVHKNFSETILGICMRIDSSIKSLDLVYDHAIITHSTATPEEKLQEELEDAKQLIESSSHPLFWKEVCKELLSELGVGKYTDWIAQLVLQNRYHDTVILKARSQKSLVWLKRNFSESILRNCQKLDTNISYVEFAYE